MDGVLKAYYFDWVALANEGLFDDVLDEITEKARSKPFYILYEG